MNTQVVILAGGLGTRISEETNTKPKPHGNHWREAYTLAYNESILLSWFQ
jgi:hypothetical protein